MTDTLDNSAPFNDDQGTRIAGDAKRGAAHSEPTGAGAEAAEGIHGQPSQRDTRRDPSDRTSLEDRESGEKRKGSEPIDSDSHEHESGYGGRGGQPKESNGTDGADR